MIDTLLDQLAEADGSSIKVAVVDTGVEPDHPWIGGHLTQSYGVTIHENGDCEIGDLHTEDVVGHGTACAGQIRRFAPNCELISVRILDKNRSSTSKALLSALHWLVKQDVKIINFSLSTMKTTMALELCHAVDDLNAHLISSINARGYHQNGRDYPTTFSGVTGVSYKEMKSAAIELRQGDWVEFNGAGVDVEVAWINGSTKLVTGSSYATPLVCGLATRLLSLNPELAPYEIKSLLRQYAIRQAEGWWEDWMDKVDQPPV